MIRPRIKYFRFFSCILLILVNFSCQKPKEAIHVLTISPNSESRMAIETKIKDFLQDRPYKFESTSNISALQRDTISEINLLVLDDLLLAQLDQYQINVLECYLEAGGTILGIGLNSLEINRYKSDLLHRFFGQDNTVKKPIVNKFGKGNFISIGNTSMIIETLDIVFSKIKKVDYASIKTSLTPPDHWFKIDTLHALMNEPIQMEVLPDSDLILIERQGAIKLYRNETGAVDEIARLQVITTQSNGLNGLAIAPDFENTGYIYFSYLSKEDPMHQRISRFTFSNDTLPLSSEKIVMEIPIVKENGWHGTNGLDFDSQGNLYISMGDFTLQTEDIAGYAQIDERPGNSAIDAQQTSANSNSYYGKILRIHPEPDGTYTIPKGNLYPELSDKTKPEIYIMGCRNPYRFSLDSHTNALYFGDVGPDALTESEKGPNGYDEVNVAIEGGFYGWPYGVADNKMYNDYDYATRKVGLPFKPENPVNTSPNNTGVQELPPSKTPMLWYPKSRLGTKFPYTGNGGVNIMVGPRYYANDFPESSEKFPSYFDGRLFIYDCVRNWIITLGLNETGTKIEHMAPFQYQHFFARPIDMKFGPDGTLYVLEYGNQGYHKNEDATIKRIRYVEGREKPETTQKAIPGSMASWKEMLPVDQRYQKGRELLLGETCLTCHRPNEKIIGPSFEEIAERYMNDKDAQDTLAKKIINGGTGNWTGNIIMPANIHLSEEEAQELSGYILSFK